MLYDASTADLKPDVKKTKASSKNKLWKIHDYSDLHRYRETINILC